VTVASPQLLLAVFLWAALVVYGFSAGWWLLETAVLSRGWQPGETEWDLDAVQVRILTIDAADVVQATVDALPETVADVQVNRVRPGA
jgi:hypothetical protein